MKSDQALDDSASARASVRASAPAFATPSANPSATPANSATPATPAAPWWRFGMMWLVVGGPSVVVVASFVTLALAILNPDPVYKQAATGGAAELPAVQGRNHAATPKP